MWLEGEKTLLSNHNILNSEYKLVCGPAAALPAVKLMIQSKNLKPAINLCKGAKAGLMSCDLE